MVNSIRTPKPRRMAALWVRLTLAGFLVSVLTGSHAVSSANPRTVVFAMDISDSISSTDQALTYLAETAERSLARPDRLALVVFGRDAMVEVPPVSKIQVEPIEARVDRKGTNLEEALNLSLALVTQEAMGRIVLVSDGSATDGDVTRILPTLKSRGVAVDVLPVEYVHANEVWLDSLQLPVQDRAGRADEATVQLSALTEGFGKLTVGDNGVVVAEQQVTYKSGANQFLIPLPEARPGHHRYVANIEVDPSRDAVKQNNTVSNDLFVEGNRTVLLVANGHIKGRNLPPLEAAISNAAHQIEIVGPRDLSASVSRLASYDSIIFCDVHRDQFEIEQLQAVYDAVCDQGVGFLMAGGANSFGPGGYEKTPIEEILPVSVDASHTSPSRVAVAIVMDQLHVPEEVTWSRRLTKQTIKMLRADDESCVLIESSLDGKLLVPLAPASGYEKGVPAIHGARIDPIRQIDRLMAIGLLELQKSTAGTRQMLLVLDGRCGPPSHAVVERFINAKVALSIVAVPARDGMRDGWMRVVADATGGRYYQADDPVQIDQMLTQEVRLLKHDVIRQRNFTPVAGAESEIVSDLGMLPALGGYVVTIPKQGDVTHVLNVPPAGQAGNSPHPLLAIWRPGSENLPR